MSYRWRSASSLRLSPAAGPANRCGAVRPRSASQRRQSCSTTGGWPAAASSCGVGARARAGGWRRRVRKGRGRCRREAAAGGGRSAPTRTACEVFKSGLGAARPWRRAGEVNPCRRPAQGCTASACRARLGLYGPAQPEQGGAATSSSVVAGVNLAAYPQAHSKRLRAAWLPGQRHICAAPVLAGLASPKTAGLNAEQLGTAQTHTRDTQTGQERRGRAWRESAKDNGPRPHPLLIFRPWRA